MKNGFREVAAVSSAKNYEKLIGREGSLLDSDGIRTPFARDYTRILHSNAYRRLKHKTQVFFNVDGDHICTRMEHVLHVESVSDTIAKYLGLNNELTRAIALGHDLGHAPFGHFGETVLDELYFRELGERFWHEKNGLYMVDNLELLPNREDEYENLFLTYAVRDGIVAHCGETNVNALKPREEFIDLKNFEKGAFEAITYEGCVVKLSDKIAYLGRDIEDATTLRFLSKSDLDDLSRIVRLGSGGAVNTSSIINGFIADVCEASTPSVGIRLSEEKSETLNKIKAFNQERIYENEKFAPYRRYARIVLEELFSFLLGIWDKEDVFARLDAQEGARRALLAEFSAFLKKYAVSPRLDGKNYKNKKLYDLSVKKDYTRAVLDFLSGMTDRYAVESFSCLISY